jgi:hypothetical protein
VGKIRLLAIALEESDYTKTGDWPKSIKLSFIAPVGAVLGRQQEFNTVPAAENREGRVSERISQFAENA